MTQNTPYTNPGCRVYEVCPVITSTEQSQHDAMKEVVDSCIAADLQELKYRILFPAGDVVTRTILETTPRTWTDALDWMIQPDQVTKMLYPNYTQDVLIYPTTDNRLTTSRPPLFLGPLGSQFSKHHLETTREHAISVASRLIDEEEGMTDASLALGILHDIGKKYTAASNSAGETCFYRHEALSAYIAGLWLRKNPALVPCEWDLWTVVAAIFYHMIYKITSQRYAADLRMKEHLQCFFAGTSDCSRLTLYTMALVQALDWVDQGYTTPESYADAKLHLDAFEKRIRNF